MGLNIYFTKRKSEQIGCFRKVNFLVKYFKDLGFNVENQTPFCISKEDAEVLLSRCNQVLKDHSLASELLPTMSGFFFGSTEYDKYYFEDVKEVRDYIKNALLPKFEELESEEDIFFETCY